MVKILMHGCNGKMGKSIASICKEDENAQIVAGVDAYNQSPCEFPVYASLDEVKEDVDVIIDFSNAAAIDHLLEFAVERQLPVVLCTTGLSDEQIQKVHKCSEKVAILRSANMSLGINLLMKQLKEAVKVLGEAGFDVEIVEKHHNQKVDAPSGTALALADSINEAMDGRYEYVYDRSQVRQKREKKELGISSVRGGTIVGDHDVIFAGEDEVITFSHRAYSKAVFAKGAVSAAKFMQGQKPGMYDMAQVIDVAN